MRWRTAAPDHDAIATFRRENLAKVGVVSVDGSKLDARANRRRSVRYNRTGELASQFRTKVSALLARAETADASSADAGDELPEEIARRKALCARLDEARAAAATQRRRSGGACQTRHSRPCVGVGGGPKTTP